jgi:hypothetical protein
MPKDETVLVLFASAVGAVFAAWRFGVVDGFGWAAALAGLIGFDVAGGAVCNATLTTKRWYHRIETGWRAKVAFVIPHLGYVALIAWLWRGRTGFDWGYFAVFSVALAAGCAAVLIAPKRLAAPVAFAAFLAALTMITLVAGVTPGLEWFAPGLLLKLLVGHLVPPEPAPAS